MSTDVLPLSEAPCVASPAPASVCPSAIPRSVVIAQILILGLLFAIPAIWALRLPYVIDADIWWHLSIGDWIVQHHALPHTDFMSRSVAGNPWQAYSWLFDLLVSSLYRHFGLLGIVLYTTAMFLGIAVATYRLAARSPDFSLASALTFVVVFSISPMETPRSWLFTILFSLLELQMLMRVRSSGKARDLAWLPLILALWANLHIQFIHGVIILFIAFAESLVSRRVPNSTVKTTPLMLGSTLCISILATLLNPYSWHVYRIAYEFGTQAAALNKISEIQAMSFRDAPNFVILFMAMAPVAVIARQRRPMLFETALLLFATYMAFHSRRDVWLIAVAASAILGSADVCRRQEAQPQHAPRFAIPAACLLAIITAVATLRASHLNNTQLAALQPQALPIAATDFITTHHLQGPLYNTFDWGGYLYWRLGMPVSMDGRVAPYGAERIDRSAATWNGQPDWASDPLLQSANLVIGPVNSPLTQLLRMDHRFQLVFEDKLAAVFTRQQS